MKSQRSTTASNQSRHSAQTSQAGHKRSLHKRHAESKIIPLRFHRQIQKFKEKGNRRKMANVGALTMGALGIMLADIVGVGEIAIGAIAAYAAYRTIRYGVAPTAALLEGVELEHGETPKRQSQAA